jgi:hypothetical protein
LPYFSRKYLLYKALSETAKLYLKICLSEGTLSRANALKKALERSGGALRQYLANVVGWPKRLCSQELLDEDMAFNLLIDWSVKIFEVVGQKACSGEILDISTWGLEEEDAGLIASKPAHLFGLPLFYFGADIFNNQYLDFHAHYLCPGEKPSFSETRGFLLRSTARFPKNDELLLVVGPLAFSLSLKKPETCIYEFDRSNKTIILHDHFRSMLDRRLRLFDSFLAVNSIYKLRPAEFFRFFWCAAQTKLLARSPGQITGEGIPLTSEAVAVKLGSSFDGRASLIARICEEYGKANLGLSEDTGSLYPEAVEFLKNI